MMLTSTKQIPSIDVAAPKNIETITLGLGCFWGAEAQYGVLTGVVRTRVGFVGNHTEVVQLDFDPQYISLDALLTIFWQAHDPTQASLSDEYRSMIVTHSDAQDEIARHSQQQIVTDIVPYTGFSLARDFHQKYALKQHKAILDEFKRIYRRHDALIASTAVTRANGYLNGYGTMAGLREEIDSYGLSDAGKSRLLDVVAQYG